VADFVLASISAAGLPGGISDYVDFDESLVRPAEVNLLLGDPSKAKRVLGWQPKVNFEGLVQLMVMNDLAIEGD
jgi:GDPmannose 4,6-dehydratase